MCEERPVQLMMMVGGGGWGDDDEGATKDRAEVMCGRVVRWKVTPRLRRRETR